MICIGSAANTLRIGQGEPAVVAAYDPLQALGPGEAKRQRGLCGRESGGDASKSPAGESGVRAQATRPGMPVSATSLIRGMFEAPGARPMPGMGLLPADWFDLPILASALRQVTQGAQLGAMSLQCGDPAGEPRLRRALAAELVDHGIGAAPEQIVTLIGATHALGITTRTLLRAGDGVRMCWWTRAGMVGGVRAASMSGATRSASRTRCWTNGCSRPARSCAPATGRAR